MALGSLRLKLTAWNLSVLAVSLIAFAGAMTLGNRKRAEAEIDRELRMRASRITMGPGPMLRRQQQGGVRMRDPEPPGDGEPVREPRFEPDQQPGGQGFRDGPRQQGDPPPLRQAQFFDPSGKLIAPDANRRPFAEALVAGSLAGRDIFATVDYEGEPLRVLSVPVFREGRVTGAVQVARELRDFRAQWLAQTWTLAWFLPLALIVAGVGAFFLTNRALKPVGELTQAASEITAKDLSKRLDVSGSDEFAQLGGTLNAMIARLEGSFTELERAYKDLDQSYEAHRRFTADASHELRTPLTRLRLATSAALSNGATEAELREALRVADAAGQSLSNLVQQLLLLSKADSGNLGLRKTTVDLRVVVADALEATPQKAGVERIVQLPQTPIMAEADEDHLRRAIINLVGNAQRHTDEGGRVAIAIAHKDGWAAITVEDSGEGIAPQHLPKLFDRFYRVDSARTAEDGGTGLGLAIVKSIAEAHGGSVRAESTVGIGTRMTVMLPCRQV